jgi:hypothetical protein
MPEMERRKVWCLNLNVAKQNPPEITPSLPSPLGDCVVMKKKGLSFPRKRESRIFEKG